LNWNSFQDTTSGIQYYEYAIGTVPGQSNVLPWANVGMDTAAVDSELVLNHGITYYGSVRVTDNVGNVSNPYSSNGITVDLFNPTVDIPVDGVLSGTDLDYQTSSNSLTVHWLPTVEAELDYYEYSFSTTIGAEDIVPWTVTTDTMAVIGSLDLAHAQIHYSGGVKRPPVGIIYLGMGKIQAANDGHGIRGNRPGNNILCPYSRTEGILIII
jgi:hypothetical protein